MAVLPVIITLSFVTSVFAIVILLSKLSASPTVKSASAVCMPTVRARFEISSIEVMSPKTTFPSASFVKALQWLGARMILELGFFSSTSL